MARNIAGTTGTANGTMEIASWDEQPYVELDDGRKLTTTTVTQKLAGDLAGEGSATWLAAYRADGTADYVGYQRIVGTLDGAEGSIVLRITGGYDGEVARSDWEVVDGTGTGAFEQMRGTGVMEATRSGTPSYTLDYELA
jgi:Protein of unknown function (DUF3224)